MNWAYDDQGQCINFHSLGIFKFAVIKKITLPHDDDAGCCVSVGLCGAVEAVTSPPANIKIQIH